jgi:hypothetical protein
MHGVQGDKSGMWLEKSRGEVSIVARRIQSKLQQGYFVENPQEDYISIEEALRHAGVTQEAPTGVTQESQHSDETTNKHRRLTDETDTIRSEKPRCFCPKKNGDYCVATLKKASPMAKRYPNKMYWTCRKSLDCKCDFFRLAPDEEITEKETDASAIICSYCHMPGHYSRSCSHK